MKNQWHLSLDEDEVSLQVALFQKRVRTRLECKDSVATRRETALHFPTSIGEGLNSFTVLRTLFMHNRGHPLDSPTNLQERDPWKRASIPVEHRFGSTSLKQMSRKVRDTDQDDYSDLRSTVQLDDALTIDRTPAYAVQIHGRYVLYRSVEGWNTASGDEPAASMALFRMPRHDQQQVELLAFVDCLEHRWPLRSCIFHQTLPLVAFCCSSIIDGPRVVLWCFTTETMRQRSGFSYVNEVFLRRSSEFIFVIPTGNDVPKQLQFSSNGQELIIQLPGVFLPKTVQLTATRAYKAAVTEGQYLERMGENEASLALVTVASQNKLKLIKADTPAALQHNEIVMHNDGSSTQLDFQGGVAGRNLHLVHRTEGVAESQALLSLPAYDDINHVKVSLRLPKTRREDKITIILNKTAKPYYTLSKSANEAGPAVIRKDIRAVAPTRKRIHSSMTSQYETPACYINEEQVQFNSDGRTVVKSIIDVEETETMEAKRPRLDRIEFDEVVGESCPDDESASMFL